MLKKGIKHDQNKEQWWLLPLDALRDVVRVLMYGAKKYAPNNWMHVRPKERYFDACIRHLADWQAGERIEPESGLPTLAHAICCLVFLLWHEKHPK